MESIRQSSERAMLGWKIGLCMEDVSIVLNGNILGI